MQIGKFQKLIEDTYFQRDTKRGVAKTFIWFTEEVGELAREIKKSELGKGDKGRLKLEFADTLAWLTTLASLLEIDLEEAAEIYKNGCPKCHKIPCEC